MAIIHREGGGVINQEWTLFGGSWVVKWGYKSPNMGYNYSCPT